MTSNLPARMCLCLVGLLASVAAVGVAPSGSATPVWSVVPSPNPSRSPVSDSEFDSVGCPSVTSCFAVGDYDAENKTLVEHWNGRTWALMTSRNPKDSSFANLSGVSCPSTTSCFAVGSYDSHAHIEGLVEHWNGSGWSMMSAPKSGTAT